MNRQQRRMFNKQHKTNFSKNDFLQWEIYQKIKGGELKSDEFTSAIEAGVLAVDNEELVPEGTAVKLNYDRIKERNQTNFTDKYKDWIEQNKDKIFHITREQAKNSLVCLKENLEEGGCWLFDIFNDLLYEGSNEEWIMLYEKINQDS